MRWLVVPTALTVGLALAACGSSSNSSDGPSSTPNSDAGVAQAKTVVAKYLKAPTKINQTAPLPKAPPTGKTFVFLLQTGITTVAAQGQYVSDAVKALGWQYKAISYDSSNSASFQSALSSALSDHPTAVGVVGMPTSEFGASTVAEFKQAGIPIITSETNVDTADSSVILGPTNGPTSTGLEGKLLANWFVADSAGNGSAVMVNIPSFPVLNAVAAAFQSETGNICSACTTATLNVTLQQLTAGSIPGAVISYLQAHQNVKYVFFTNSDWAAGITQALKGAGLNVKVGGTSPTAEQLGELRAGTQSVWTGNNLAVAGYGMVDIAARYVEGAPITDGNSIGPQQLLTPDNVGSMTAFTEPSDALDQYKKLWKVQ